MPSTPHRNQFPGYDLIGELGSGSHSRVYKARQISLDRVVAIKVLSPELVAKPGFIDRFQAEGQAAAKLNHVNIVSAYDVAQSQGAHYLVMEFVEGETLFEDIESGEVFDELEVAQLGLQVARGLLHAHEHGLIHRDVKPQNIIIARDGTAKLADLGLAAPVADAADTNQQEKPTGPREIHGSPYYVSPEQITGQHELDPRTDIYSLGATLYVMATGQLPFDGPTPNDVFKAHLKADFTPPSKINPILSQSFDHVIQTCRARNRDDRYDSCRELIADLEAIEMQEDPLHSAVKLGDFSDDEPAATTRASAAASESVSSITPETFMRRPRTLALWEQPLFWAAIAGWALAFLFFGLWLVQV